MLISELIRDCEAVLEEYGDIEVICYPYDGQQGSYEPITEVIQDSKEKSFLLMDANNTPG